MKKAYLWMLGVFFMVVAACSQQTNMQTAAGEENIEKDSSAVLAFPGAEGYGQYTRGGRGGKVILVTNLKDHGPGSLRAAIEQVGPRIVVFKVAGYIDLESPLVIEHGDLTIAGQSAPGDGITVRNYPIKVIADNIIIRYIRSRMGDKYRVEDDAISGMRNKDIIVDHCSFSWGTDECASFYDNENFTLQWSIISESLNNSVHHKGEHGYGGIWGGKGATFHHNLLAHHKSRLPRFNGARTQLQDEPEKEVADFRNNVVYNWVINSSYAGERGRYNMVKNYYKPGPATQDDVRNRIVNPWEPYGRFYVAENYMLGSPEVSSNNRKGVDTENPDEVLVASPIPVVNIQEEPAEKAFEAVLAHAGASKSRDAVDQRVVEEVRTGKGSSGPAHNGIIDTPAEAGGWPSLDRGNVPADEDQDGMPDAWEKQKNLNPQNASDALLHTLDQQYTNIEVYLNGLVEAGREL